MFPSLQLNPKPIPPSLYQRSLHQDLRIARTAPKPLRDRINHPSPPILPSDASIRALSGRSHLLRPRSAAPSAHSGLVAIQSPPVPSERLLRPPHAALPAPPAVPCPAHQIRASPPGHVVSSGQIRAPPDLCLPPVQATRSNLLCAISGRPPRSSSLKHLRPVTSPSPAIHATPSAVPIRDHRSAHSRRASQSPKPPST